MRCYSCDKMHPSVFDGATGRYYCSTCWTAIDDAVGRVQDDDVFLLTDQEEDVTLEVSVKGNEVHDRYQEHRQHTSDVS